MKSTEHVRSNTDDRPTTDLGDRARQTPAGPNADEGARRSQDDERDRVADRERERILAHDAAAAIAEQTPSPTTPEPSQGPPPLTRPSHESKEPRSMPHGPGGLIGEREAERLRDRWTTIQSGFVDEPRRAAKEADALVADVIKRLADVFSTQHRELEQQWDRGNGATTEDLRLAVQRYHTFFDRLLSF